MADTLVIGPELAVNEAIRLVPAAVSVFNAFGIDACCGGDRTIARAAAEDGADGEALLEALRRVAESAQ
jgi:regulator of cell morphogenesis and NO signaling